VARKSGSAAKPEEEPVLRVDAVVLGEQLAQRMALADEMIADRPSSPDALEAARHRFYTWDEYNETLVRKAFTTSEPADTYRNIAAFTYGNTAFHTQVAWLIEDITRQRRKLESLRDRLPLYVADALPGSALAAETSPRTAEIFIVHGHDAARREEVARFVERLTDVTPIVLHEKPNQGQTIIEKFEAQASKAAFAVVLLTADDEGGVVGSGEKAARARQNVVFETGFFTGALGRSKVALLYESGVELPSDLNGLLYTELDDQGAWKLKLAQELRAAEILIDLNRAI
jgi:predicted nucleotide-binding protein